MLIALNNNKERISINDSLENETYYCQFCGEELCRKLGKKRCHHFSHKPNSYCTDSKWHDMSEWHINWQNQFPARFQEILKIDSNGKKHIADVLVDEKIVIEFQHSNLPYEIYNDRNEFYNKMGYKVIWIFDGNKIINDGDISVRIRYRNPLKPLSRQGMIPTYLDIFIEGTIEHNLFDEEDGKFLYHVIKADETKGIFFDWKCTIAEFMNRINQIKQESKKEENAAMTKTSSSYYSNLFNIIRQYSNANSLIVYNIINGYDICIDAKNIERIMRGERAYGKFKKHGNLGRFRWQPSEIYYTKDPVWIYQNHY